MRRFFWLLAMCMVFPTVNLAAKPDQAELMGSPRFMENVTEPSFAQLSNADLRDQLMVISSRSFAVFGFNKSEIQIHMPHFDNSVYADVEFLPAKLFDAKDREVKYERERGIYDHDTYSDELRFSPVEGNNPVEFSRAEGIIKLRYPARLKTISIKPGSSTIEGMKVNIEGPFVAWSCKESPLPEAASFTPVEQWRAYDASGRRIEKHNSVDISFSGGIKTNTYAYWGEVKEVRIDVVEKWVEIQIDYNLPSAKLLPDSRQGIAPDETVPKITPGGEVNMQIITMTAKPVATTKPVPAKPVAATRPVSSEPVATAKSKSQGHAVMSISRSEAIKRLNKLGIRKFEASTFVMAAIQGRTDALKIFIAAGMPIDVESDGRTALMSAAMMGHVEAGKFLIEAGADVNKTDLTGALPLLRLSMQCKATELVKAFIKAGADLNAKMEGGITALEMARLAKCTQNARVLAAAGAR